MLASDPGRFEAFLRRMEQKTGKPLGIAVEKVREFVLDGKRTRAKSRVGTATGGRGAGISGARPGAGDWD
jgi:hypothetical protein